MNVMSWDEANAVVVKVTLAAAGTLPAATADEQKLFAGGILLGLNIAIEHPEWATTVAAACRALGAPSTRNNPIVAACPVEFHDGEPRRRR